MQIIVEIICLNKSYHKRPVNIFFHIPVITMLTGLTVNLVRSVFTRENDNGLKATSVIFYKPYWTTRSPALN